MAERTDELAIELGSRADARWVTTALAPLDADARRERLDDVIARRRRGEPLQYVLGHWQFRSLELAVDPRALIPRPETELLVDEAMDCLSDLGGSPIVCDLGCGSGAIALSVAAESAAASRGVEVHATDLSGGALALASENARRLNIAVQFHEGSWFDALPSTLRGRLDLVCSNPPYVGLEERPGLARELDYEPELALVAADGRSGTPGLAALEAVLAGSRTWLRPGGTVVVEHGATQRAAVTGCAEHAGLVVVGVRDDLAGLPRIVRAERPR